MKTVTRYFYRSFIIIFACLVLCATGSEAQTTQASGKPKTSVNSQNQKSSGKTLKTVGNNSRKSNGKPQNTNSKKNASSSNRQQKKSNSANQKSSGKTKKNTNQQTSQSLQNEQKTIKAEIAQTKKQIDENKQSTLKQLNNLDQLKGEIKVTTDNINNLTQEVRSIEEQEKVAVDSISILESKVDRLKMESAKSLRDSRKNRQRMSDLNLIFSSKSFYQAMKRTGRIRQANERAVSRTNELKESISQLNEQKQKLADLKQQHSDKLTDLSKENANLLSKQKQTQTLVSDLKKKGNSLQQVLLEKQKRMKALDNEITRLIAEEKRRAEEARRAEESRKKEEALKKEQQRKEEAKKAQEAKTNDGKAASTETDNRNSESPKPLSGVAENTAKLTGSFASNKGKLLFPVVGKYNIVSFFGRNQHEDLPNVEIDNSGIDILVQPGGTARAVFDGVVSMIVNLGGSHNVVMVRHGEYITVYSNIKSASVKKGDSVKAGQTIGTIYTDAADNNRTILHFEVRKETQKLNPLLWVKR